MSDFQLNVRVNGADRSVRTIGEVEKALKDTREELKNVEVGSQAFEELARQARLLQDELKGSFLQATNFDKELGKLTESVTRLGSSVTAGFTIATTALSAFGSKSEEITEAQVKAQQALAIAFSATALATNAAKIAGDIKLVSDRLQVGVSGLLTAAIGKETVAKSAAAAATGTATIAQRALNAAMNANPILLLVGALGLLVGALVTFSSSTKEATEEKSKYVDQSDRATKALEKEIETERRLVVLRGRINEAQASDEAGRLRVRQRNAEILNEITQTNLTNQLDANRELLRNFSLTLRGFATERLQALQEETILTDRLSTLQRQGADTAVEAERKRIQSVVEGFKDGSVAVEEYVETLLELQIATGKVYSDEEKAAIKRTLEITSQAKLLNLNLKQLNEEKALNDRLAQLELERIQKDSENRRAAAQQSFNQSQVNSIRARNAEIISIERELQDFLAERISAGLTDIVDIDGGLIGDLSESIETLFNLVKRNADIVDLATGRIIENFEDLTEEQKKELQTITINNEDIIKSYDERIVKLRLLLQRSTADALQAYNTDIEAFVATEKAKVDAAGNRLISDEKIEAAIAERRGKFEEIELKRLEVFNLKVEALAQERADKIQEIEEILASELAFGDNAINDTRIRLALEAVESEIRISERRIEVARTTSAALIKERQEFEKKRRELILQNQIETEQSELVLALKSVQGTEEQKALQRERLVSVSNEKIKRLNDEFRASEAAAEKANNDEILNAKIQLVNEIANQIQNITSTIFALSASIRESANIDNELLLRNLRDSAVNSTNIITEEFNKQLEALNNRFTRGVLSQEQYNEAVRKLEENLSEQSTKIERDRRERELDIKQQAFEDEKKLKIASAITSGFQGALQAFTTAFQLGPILGPIVGGALATLVGATTGIQVNNIRKTTFDRGAPDSIASIGRVSTGGASQLQSAGSAGGLTQFSPDLLDGRRGRRTGGVGFADDTTGRVIVVETDIRRAMDRVSVAETTSTIG